MGKPEDATARPGFGPWLVVFLVNLPVPLMLASDLTARHGRIGMAAAIVLWWYFGHRVGAEGRGFRRALIAGGGVVALAQFFPVLQILAGLFGLNVGSYLGQVVPGRHGPGELTEIGGFLVTMLTGGILISAALACGWVIGLIVPDRRPPLPRPDWDGEA